MMGACVQHFWSELCSQVPFETTACTGGHHSAARLKRADALVCRKAAGGGIRRAGNHRQ